YSESDESFRRELRAWLAEAVPAHGPEPSGWADWEARCAYDQSWQRKLYEAGYAGINWPKQYGGRDASLSEQLVYYEELARAHAPARVGRVLRGVPRGRARAGRVSRGQGERRLARDQRDALVRARHRVRERHGEVAGGAARADRGGQANHARRRLGVGGPRAAPRGGTCGRRVRRALGAG